jgi:hypothetical protein
MDSQFNIIKIQFNLIFIRLASLGVTLTGRQASEYTQTIFTFQSQVVMLKEYFFQRATHKLDHILVCSNDSSSTEDFRCDCNNSWVIPQKCEPIYEMTRQERTLFPTWWLPQRGKERITQYTTTSSLRCLP